MEGVVKSIIDEKTVSVVVEIKKRHPVYKKVLKRVKKFLVHIPEGSKKPSEGEKVEIISSKPISKLKKWTLKLN